MKIIDVKAKKWGNSFGVILPKEIVNLNRIEEGTDLEIAVRTKHKTKVKDVFGIVKLKRPTEELMKEVDEELWGIRR